MQLLEAQDRAQQRPAGLTPTAPQQPSQIPEQNAKCVNAHSSGESAIKSLPGIRKFGKQLDAVGVGFDRLLRQLQLLDSQLRDQLLLLVRGDVQAVEQFTSLRQLQSTRKRRRVMAIFKPPHQIVTLSVRERAQPSQRKKCSKTWKT